MSGGNYPEIPDSSNSPQPRVPGKSCSCGGTRAVTADRGKGAVRAACAACTSSRLSELEADVAALAHQLALLGSG